MTEALILATNLHLIEINQRMEHEVDPEELAILKAQELDHKAHLNMLTEELTTLPVIPTLGDMLRLT